MFALFGSVAGSLVHRWIQGRAWIAKPAIAVILLSLAVLSWRQSSLYVDPTTLYRDTIAKNPDAWLAHHALGVALATAGEFPEAIIQYEAALQLRPCFAEAENDLGCALLADGNSPLAQTHFQRALEIKPECLEAHNNLGNLYQKSGRLSEAIGEYQSAVRINPNSFEAHNNLGVVLRETGRVHSAVVHCQLAVQLQPDLAESRNNYGNALLAAGQIDDAILQYQEALRLKAKYIEADINLAMAYARSHHRIECASAAAEEALTWARAGRQDLLAQKIELWLKSLRNRVADQRGATISSGTPAIR